MRAEVSEMDATLSFGFKASCGETSKVKVSKSR